MSRFQCGSKGEASFFVTLPEGTDQPLCGGRESPAFRLSPGQALSGNLTVPDADTTAIQVIADNVGVMTDAVSYRTLVDASRGDP